MITLRARSPFLGCLFCFFAALVVWAPCAYAQDQANSSRQNRQSRRQSGGGQNNGNSNSNGNLNIGGLNLPFQIPNNNSNSNKNNNQSNGNNSNNNSQGGSGGKNGSNSNNNSNNSGGGTTTQQQKRDKDRGTVPNNLPSNKSGNNNSNTNNTDVGGLTPQQKQQQQKDREQGKLPMPNGGGMPNNKPSNSNGNSPGSSGGNTSSNNNSHDHNSTGHKIGGIVIDALNTKYGYGGYGRYGYPNASYYNDYYSYVPSTPPPADAPVQTNVVRNVIVQKQGPLVRNAFRMPPFDKTAAAARTDAEQISQIGALKQQSNSVIQGAVSAAGDSAVASDWAAYQQNPSTAGLAGFKEKWGAKLGPQNDGLLGATLRASKYQDDLMTGQLTSAQKDQSISEIEGLIGASLPNGPANAGMKQNLDRMRKLNALGKIVEGIQIGINAFPMLLQGAQSCGFPPSFVGQMVGVPYMDCAPMQDKPPGASGKTCLLNADNSGNAINYSLNEYPYSMGPGQTQFVDSGYVITFDNGSGATKRYTLGDGSFRFAIGPQGWDMQSATFKITIDNSNFGSDFNFAINNEPGSVRAGQAVQIQSPYPIEIMFDRGDGGEPARKRLLDGIYIVGVDPGRQCLELFDVAQLQQQQPQQQGGMMPMMGQGGVDPMEAQRRAALIQQQLRGQIPPQSQGGPNMNSGQPFNSGPGFNGGGPINNVPPQMNNGAPPNVGTAEDALRRLQGQ